MYKIKNNKKRGISLIVLLITIIIIIIIAASVILTLTNNNLIKSANKAAFVSDLDNFKSELQIYISNKTLESNGKYEVEFLNASNTYTIENGIRNDSKKYLIL